MNKYKINGEDAMHKIYVWRYATDKEYHPFDYKCSNQR
jgi:hypothetical protein